MANIQVEPKKQITGTLWSWIIVVLVIAALAYFLVTRNHATNNTTTPLNTTGAVALPGPICSNVILG